MLSKVKKTFTNSLIMSSLTIPSVKTSELLSTSGSIVQITRKKKSAYLCLA